MNIWRPLELSSLGPKRLARLFRRPGFVCRIPKCGDANVVKLTGSISSNRPAAYINPTTYREINPPIYPFSSVAYHIKPKEYPTIENFLMTQPSSFHFVSVSKIYHQHPPFPKRLPLRQHDRLQHQCHHKFYSPHS